MTSARLNILQSYVPAQLVRLLAAETERFDVPATSHRLAVALFADIAGFTKLAERLSEHGAAGAETLSEILNDSFGELVRLIHDHGGEVEKFAGDAALAFWWAESEKGLSDAALRASQCALVARDQFDRRSSIEGMALGLHVRISAGRVVLLSVGGVQGRWEFFTGGNPLEQIGAASQYAVAGEVLLSREARDLLGNHAIVAPVGENCYRLTRLPGVRGFENSSSRVPGEITGPALETSLRRYLSRTVLARIDAGQADWLAEFRRVTVLFVNLHGLDYEATEVLEALQSAICSVQKSVYEQEGMVNQVMVDDKGTTVLAVWGAAMHSHEDNAARALKAGIAIRDKLAQASMHCAVGVTTGRVFTGRRGNELRCEYAVIGDVVNLSARLMHAAKDSILCDDQTRAAAASRFEFQSLPPISVKGKSDPIDVHQPSATNKTATHDLPQMVGRDRERTVLMDRLNELANGSGGVVIVEGEPGIGKSRLVSDLLHQARLLGARGLTAAADAVEQNSSYYAWRALFAEALHLNDAGDLHAQRETVLSQLQDAPQLRANAPLLNVALPLDFTEDERVQALSQQGRAELTRQLLVALLRKCLSETPTLIVLEDAHWLDSASWALALEAYRKLDTVLIVVAMRPMGDGALAQTPDLLGVPNTLRLVLEPLSPDHASTLVCERLGVSSIPPVVERLIAEKAVGHPFFLEEFAQALQESGLIEVRNGKCRLSRRVDDLDGLDFPDSVEGLIVSRIDRLAPQQQLIIKVASVIGRTFSLDALRDSYPVEADKLRLGQHLQTLHRLNLTAIETPAPNPTFAFRHAITQEVSYSLLPFSQRRQLHRAVAEFHERRYTADLSPHYSVLAHHWSRAEIAPKAVEYLEKAGDQASLSGAHLECSTFFDMALKTFQKKQSELSSTIDAVRVAQWRRQLSFARLGLGDLSGCTDHLLTALASLGQPAPKSKPAWLRVLLWNLLNIPGRLPGIYARKHVATEQQRLAEAARLAERLMQPYYYAGDFVPFLGSSVIATRLAERADILGDVPRAQVAIALSLGIFRLHALAERRFDAALTTAREHRRHYDLVAAHYVKCIYHQGYAQWHKAEVAGRNALRNAQELGDPQAVEESQTVIGLVAVFTGRFAESTALFEQILVSSRDRSNRHHESWGLYGIARAMIGAGQTREASVFLEEGMDLLTGLGDILSETICYGLLCKVRLDQNRLDDARTAADEVCRRVRQSLMRSPVIYHGHTGACETYMQLWEQALHERLQPAPSLMVMAKRACADLRTFARIFPMGRPAAALYAARLHWFAGRRSRARFAWRRALRLTKDLHMPYERALIHLDRGRLEGPDRTASREDLEMARKLFAQLGCVGHVDKVSSNLAMGLSRCPQGTRSSEIDKQVL